MAQVFTLMTEGTMVVPMNETEIPKLVGLIELAERWGVSAATLRRAVHAGKVPAYSLTPGRGSKLMLREDDVLAWLESVRINK